MQLTYPESYQAVFEGDNFSYLSEIELLDGDVEYQFTSSVNGIEADGTTMKFPLSISLTEAFSQVEVANFTLLTPAHATAVIPMLEAIAQQWLIYNPLPEEEIV